MILLTCVLTVASLTTPADNMFEFLKPEPVLDGPTAVVHWRERRSSDLEELHQQRSQPVDDQEANKVDAHS